MRQTAPTSARACRRHDPETLSLDRQSPISMHPLTRERLVVIAGASRTLRQEALQPLLDAWQGERQIYRSEPDLALLLADLDSASLFGPGIQYIVQVDDNWVRAAQTSWRRSTARPLKDKSGCARRSIGSCYQGREIAENLKQLVEREAVVDTSPPRRDKDFVDWLRARLSADGSVVRDVGGCASALREARGIDVDAG